VDEIGWMRMHVWGCVFVDFLLPERTVKGHELVMQQSCGQKKKKGQGVTRGSKGVCQEVADSKRKNSRRGS